MARSVGVALVAALVVAPTASCSALSPEVGDRLAACVDADSDPNTKVSFANQIRPLMKGSHGARACGDCHIEGANTQEGFLAVHLDLSTLGKLRKGGINTRDDIVVKGSPCKSALVQKLRGTYEGAHMPKGGPFWSPEDIQLVMDWIAEGAVGEENE